MFARFPHGVIIRFPLRLSTVGGIINFFFFGNKPDKKVLISHLEKGQMRCDYFDCNFTWA